MTSDYNNKNMMMIDNKLRFRTMLFILFFSTTSSIFAQKETIFLKANEYYKNGNYDSALLFYNTILDSGYHSAELYYNLGNVYYRKGENAFAILNYEKSLKINPSDEQAMFNLELANSQLTDKITVIPEFYVVKWWKQFLTTLNPNQWAFYSVIFFVVTLLLLLVYLFSRILLIKKLSFWLAVVTFFISSLSFSNAYYRKNEFRDKKEAIVVSGSVTVKSTPDDTGTDLFVIHEGLKVLVTDQLGEWRSIRLADGNKGWLRISDIEFI